MASKRGHAANIYADKKNTRYSRIITERSLDINYRSFIVESFGAFASDTWKFINTVCDPNTHPKANDEYNVDKGSVGRSSPGVEIRGKGCHAEKS